LYCHARSSVFFFFSSRRRHTRFKCDWSSDVCSSDLSAAGSGRAKTTDSPARRRAGGFGRAMRGRQTAGGPLAAPGNDRGAGVGRSEERRVGKGGRGWGGAGEEKKNGDRKR